jgi:hypothetical protein
LGFDVAVLVHNQCDPPNGWAGALEAIFGGMKKGLGLASPGVVLGATMAENVAKDMANNATTVYTNMQSDVNNSTGYCAYVAGGTALARPLGVENLSYIWNSTDRTTIPAKIIRTLEKLMRLAT